MEKSKRLRSKRLNDTQGPRYWREEEFIKKRKIVHQYLTLQEATEGNLRAFNKCQLRYDKDGRKVRTDIPRPMPGDDFDFKRKRRGRELEEWDNS